jgi:hypothetical protein
MIIKSIELQNFQIHKHTRLNMAGFTAIMGPSSAGKSSILRGLDWLFYGDWDKTYPNDPLKATAVAIELEDGTRIIRMRRDNENQAAIIKGDKTKKFKAFGETIPGIFELINIRPIKLGQKTVNLNISRQDDPIFMVNESRPTKAQWLGRLYGAHILSAMLRLMNKDKRDSEASRRLYQKRVELLEGQLKSFGDAKFTETALNNTKTSLKLLEKLDVCMDLRRDIEVEEKTITGHMRIKAINATVLRGDIDTLGRLYLIRDGLLKVGEGLDTLRPQMPILGIRMGDIRVGFERLGRLIELKEEAESADAELESVSKRMKDGEKKLSSIKKEVKTSLFSTGKCPVCNSRPGRTSADSLSKNLRQLMGA